MRAVQPRLGVKQLERHGEMALRGPRVGATARLLAGPEALGGNMAVRDRSLELGCSFLVAAGSSLEIVLAHRSGNSLGQEIGVASGKRAYASAGLIVSTSTPAPCRAATSLTG